MDKDFETVDLSLVLSQTKVIYQSVLRRHYEILYFFFQIDEKFKEFNF